MTTSEIVDTHITANIDYYRNYCNKLYRGRYLADDLFQMFYEKAREISEDRILRFHENNMLVYLFTKEIRSIFGKRGRAKTANKDSSPLFETCNVCESSFNFESVETSEYDYALETKRQKAEEKIIEKLQSNDWAGTSILVQSQNETLTSIAEKTGIRRQYLSKACNQAKLEIRRYVND